MAYDRYDRDNRARPQGRDHYYNTDRDHGRSYGERSPRSSRQDDRGWFERAGDEVASWFADDDDERRRGRDHMMDRQPPGDRHDRNPYRASGRDDERHDRSPRDDSRRNEGFYAVGGTPRSSYDRDDDRVVSSRRFSASTDDRGPFGSRLNDPHYSSWRQRQIDDLDRDYDEYRRENQARFESEFASWRERRQLKRSLLGSVREQMDVVGSDDEHVGTVDRVAGDRLILAKTDPDAGGVHHSLGCADIDRIEENRVILDCSAADAKSRWRDENRSRALFGRDVEDADDARMLDRNHEGSYR